MAEIAEDFLESLKSVRGEFQNTQGGKIGNKVLAHIFSTLFPIFFIGYLLVWEKPQWPFSGEQWLFLGFAAVSLFTGLVLHRSINNRYVFDDQGIQEFRSNGRLKQRLFWKDLVRVDYLESRGVKSFILKTHSGVMQLEYYKSLNQAIEGIEYPSNLE